MSKSTVGSVILYPLITEETVGLIEHENKLVFIVDRKASKRNVKEAVESSYEVAVIKVTTTITPENLKKAFVKLSPKNPASDLAMKLGIL